MGEINTFSEKVRDLRNTGFKQLIGNKIGVIRGIIIGMNGSLEFATASDALTKANWVTKMKATKSTRAFMLPLFDAITDKSTDDTYSDGLQGSKFNEFGKISFEAMIDANTYLALNLNGFSFKDLDAIFIDESSSLIGRTPDGTKVTGFSIDLVVGKPKLAGKGEKMMIPLTVTIKDSKEFIYERAVIEPMNETNYWNPLTDIDGVYDVELTVTEPSATGFKVSVMKKSIDTSMNSAAVSGLVKADFVLKSVAGVVKTITTVEESEVAGVYDVVATVESTDTIDLVACSSISLTTIMIESLGKQTITIV